MNISSTSVFSEPLFKFTLTHFRRELPPIHNHRFKPKLFSLLASSNHHSTFCNSSPPHRFQAFATNTDTLESLQSADVLFNQTFPINRIELLEGKIFVRLDQGKDLKNWELTVGCSLPGKWILHWGVSRLDDAGSEWDQPPGNMIPPGSVPIKDYAIETPLKKSSSSGEGDTSHEVRIDIKPNNGISAVNFVLKDKETGAWYQHKGRDFKVPLVNYIKEDANIIGPRKSFNLLAEQVF